MTERTHVPKIQEIALELCRAVPFARLIWERKYAANPALLAALLAAETACSTPVAETEKGRDYGDLRRAPVVDSFGLFYDCFVFRRLLT